MDLIHPSLIPYLDSLLPERPEVFRELEERATRENFPAIGPQVGALLELLARAIGAQRVIDLGSGFGYSGLWLARGLRPEGKIILTDQEPEHREAARQTFAWLGWEDRLDFRLGDAVEIFRSEPGPFDLIFNDVDKEAYPEVLELAYERLRLGGVFVTDNTLWDGQVVKKQTDEATRCIKEFNRKLAQHPGFISVQIPLRDGVAVAVKK